MKRLLAAIVLLLLVCSVTWANFIGDLIKAGIQTDGSGNVTILGDLDFNNDLTVKSGNDLSVAGGDLNVVGSTTLTGPTYIVGATTITGTTTVNGNFVGTGTAAITGAITGASVNGAVYPVVPFTFYLDNVSSGTTATAMTVPGQNAGTGYVMPYAGKIVAVSVLTNNARTAGACVVDPTIDGTVTGLNATLDGSNTTKHYATQSDTADTFTAGKVLGCKWSTVGGFAPTTADITVVVFVKF